MWSVTAQRSIVGPWPRRTLLRLVEGYCRKNNASFTQIPQQAIYLMYAFTKQLWAGIDHNFFELFDLVYYRMYLPPKVVRTYLHQMISELERNPKMSVIEPHDLLLDKSLSLMIVNQENRTNVSTYLAPELLESTMDDQQQYQQRYDNTIPTITKAMSTGNLNILTERHSFTTKCAIFSLGVILFILLIGNIPFEIALSDDRWFKMLKRRKFKRFWKIFESDPSFSKISDDAKELLQNMLSERDHRSDIEQIKNSAFYNGPIYLKSEDLVVALQYEYNVKEEYRRSQMVYHHGQNVAAELASTINPIFNIDQSELFPEDELEGIFDAYCEEIGYQWIIYAVAKAVEEQYRGGVHWKRFQQSLVCMVQTDRDKIKFGMKVYESRRWRTAWNDRQFEKGSKRYRAVHAIRFYRIEGDSYEFLKIKNLRLLICADIMTGLSDSRRKRLRKLHETAIHRQSVGDPDGLNREIFIAQIPSDLQKCDHLDLYLF